MMVSRRFRRDNISNSPFRTINPDRNERFVKRTSALYLERLMKVCLLTDMETIKIIVWLLGEKIDIIILAILETFNKKEKEKYMESFRIAHNDPEELCELLYAILKNSGRKSMQRYVQFCSYLLQETRKKQAYSGLCETEKKINALAKMFNMTEHEKKLTVLLTVVSLWRQCEEYFVDFLHCQDIGQRRTLKTILDMNEKDLNSALSGRLAEIDFFEQDRIFFKLSEEFISYFEKPTADFLNKQYFVRFSRKTIPLKYHLVDPKITDNILALLSRKRESPNHILLYGPPGTGKTSYALGLAGKLGIPSYEIQRDKENMSGNRRAAIVSCMNMTNCRGGSLIVVDEADNLLNTQMSWLFRGETQDKGWLNKLLEEPDVRMIWITNSISQIEESVMRRFAFTIHFRQFNRQQRVFLWENILRKYRIKRFFKGPEINRLASRFSVSAAIIDMAIKKSLEISSPDHESFKDNVIMNLESHLILLNGGMKIKKKEYFEENYSLEGLNVEGNLKALMCHLKEFDKYIQSSGSQDGPGNLNLVFHGPPGTGKSELARYISRELDRDLIVKRASDILNPYVGGTEKNLRSMFEEAENNEAVLVIDEADSFLFERERAVKSWEISHTNEFLTQMERFRGILICTTNSFNALDHASIRRFNYKIAFHHLKPESNLIFYKKLLSPLCNEMLSGRHQALLGSINNLSPGDFRLVRDRYRILPQNQISHEMMIQALHEESRIKTKRDGTKPVGFQFGTICAPA